MKIKFFIFITLLLLVTKANLAAENKISIPPLFTAHFELYKNGLHVADTTYQLSKKDNIFFFRSTINVTGLLSLFSDDKIIEKSSFKITDNEFNLINYQFIQSGKTQLSIHSTVDTKQKAISTTINNEAPLLKRFIKQPWDKLSILLALMTSVKDQKETVSFNVLDRNDIKPYDFTYAGSQEIELGEDEWKLAVLWKRQDDTKETIFFLDPEAYFIPLKIEQFKNHTLNATLLLSGLTWN